MELQAFTKTYGRKTVLRFPDYCLAEGTVYAVIGANGSGKSTFLRILAGVLANDQKRSPFAGVCRTGYMPQKSYAFHMSTEKNILLGGGSRERADLLMERLALTGLARQRADRLSGGETARMALARTLMGRYDLVLLDEPTAAMDISSAAEAEASMLEYRNETGCAMVIVTHSIRQAGRLGEQILFFHQGELWESGPASQVLERPEREETKRFLEFYGA